MLLKPSIHLSNSISYLLIQTSHTFIFLKKKPIFNLIFVKICFHHIPFMLPANITHQTPNKWNWTFFHALHFELDVTISCSHTLMCYVMLKCSYLCELKTKKFSWKTIQFDIKRRREKVIQLISFINIENLSIFESSFVISRIGHLWMSKAHFLTKKNWSEWSLMS